jgi:hypothetical protein
MWLKAKALCVLSIAVRTQTFVHLKKNEIQNSPVAVAAPCLCGNIFYSLLIRVADTTTFRRWRSVTTLEWRNTSNYVAVSLPQKVATWQQGALKDFLRTLRNVLTLYLKVGRRYHILAFNYSVIWHVGY